MNRPSLIWKFYPPYLLLVIVLTMAAALSHWQALRQAIYEQARNGVVASTHLALLQVQSAWRSADDLGAIPELLTQMSKRTGLRFTLIAADGRPLFDSHALASNMDNHADRPEFKRAMEGGIAWEERVSFTLGKPMIYVTMPVEREQRLVAAIRTGVFTADVQPQLKPAWDELVSTAILSGLGLAILGLILLLWIARPLQNVAQAARRLADGEMAVQIEVPSSKEVGGIAESLNRMATQLDEKIRTISQQNLQQQAVLTSMNEGVMAIDTQERVIALNRSAAELLGVNLSEARGRSIQEVIRNTQLQRFISLTLSSDQPLEDDITLTTEPDPRFLQASGTPLRSVAGGKIGALVVLNDVTRLRRLENVRREFVANVSHELKTPVTAIKGFTETLREALEENEEPQRLLHFLGIIARQADRLQQIIEDLLMLSRIEQDNEESQIKLTDTDLRPVLEAAIDTCQPKASEADIRITLDCPPELRVQASAPLLEQAIVNLLDNAIKYSVRGDTVMVSTVVTDQEIAIQVRDHGVGISPEHLPHLFQRFYRVDKGRSRKLGGTGLGLAIVKHIAQTHHGRATVESTQGKGSVFTVHLPVG